MRRAGGREGAGGTLRRRPADLRLEELGAGVSRAGGARVFQALFGGVLSEVLT